jgi:hypothetical protein
MIGGPADRWHNFTSKTDRTEDVAMAEAVAKGGRAPAVAMQPVIDPAGWRATDMQASDRWSRTFGPAEIAEIGDAVATIERRGLEITAVRRKDFPLRRTAALLADVEREVADGVGFVQIRGLPVASMTRRQAAIAFFGIGSHFGEALSQNAAGHVLGHVKDLGLDYNDPHVRGYQTKVAMGFHTDQCDWVGLLCLNTAQSGGESRIVSAVTLYNEMLARRPDLVAELTAAFHWSRHGEIPPGQPPWYRLPIFAFEQGYFSAKGISSHIMKALELPGVPPLTDKQKEAFALFRALANELALDIPFRQGDLQILNNHVMLHSRRPYADWPEQERKRHLLRIWLRSARIRPVPPLVRENFLGIEVEGFRPKAPLEAEPDNIAA